MLVPTVSYSQKLQFHGDNYDYITGKLDEYITFYFSENNLPMFYGNPIHEMIQDQTGEFSKYMTYDKGLKIRLDSFFYNNPERLNTTTELLPQYIFHFVYSDSLKGISRYEYRIGLDRYGQIIFMDFPHGYNFNSYDITSLDEAKKLADSVIKQGQFIYDSFSFNLIYDELYNELLWAFDYSQIDTIKRTKSLKYNTLKFLISTREQEVRNRFIDSTEILYINEKVDNEILLPILK